MCDIIECANASFPSNERAMVEFLSLNVLLLNCYGCPTKLSFKRLVLSFILVMTPRVWPRVLTY